MFAVVNTGGQQHRVVVGDYLRIAHKSGKAVGDEIIFDEVLLVKDDSGIKAGAKALDGITVTATVVRQDIKDLEARTTPLMGKKITIFKRRRRKTYRRTKGFRPLFTQVKITGISG
jgi:large subunit ribosomal protein L21